MFRKQDNIINITTFIIPSNNSAFIIWKKNEIFYDALNKMLSFIKENIKCYIEFKKVCMFVTVFNW